jgi:glucoamylase
MQTQPVPAAFGWPGIEPTGTRGGKDRVGTAYTASTLIWFSFWNGIITEVYYPTVDRLQLLDLQYLITDGNIFFHDEKRHLKSQFERLRFHPNQRDLDKLRPGMSVTPKVHLD